MKLEYRFRRTKDGVTSFAAITISSEPTLERKVAWADEAISFKGRYGEVVEAALERAALAHEARGGAPQDVRIESIVEIVSDTKPDAVACAAALAAWKGWGYDESAAEVALGSTGEWEVRFRDPR